MAAGSSSPCASKPTEHGPEQRLATDNGIVDFGTDPRNGDLIFCDLGAGTVKRLARSGTTGTTPPALLSQTGAFANLATLTPNPGIVDYEPNVPFWSDYAIKSRWFAIRNLTDTAGFSADGNWSLPTGMVWIKHFDIETTRGVPATRRKLETRILVKTATDIYGLSYKWKADQSDADLVTEEGLSETIPSSNPLQTWRYPSRTECRVCHTGVAGFALSFNTRQLNRTHAYGTQTLNQISALSDARTSDGTPASYFTAGTAPATTNTLPAFAPADDAANIPRMARALLPCGELRAVPPTRRHIHRQLGCPRDHFHRSRQSHQRPAREQRRRSGEPLVRR